MLNPFYDYIADLLLKYLIQLPVKQGDRFYLQLDKHDEVELLVESLRGQEHAEEFIYQHELGEPYTTFSIKINKIQLVIAFTSELVKPDFLVTLRNQVGEQHGVWENTALFSIVSEQLDSIQGGSSDVQKEGMPLHPNSLVKKLKYEIEDSSLNKVDKIILNDHMEKILQEQEFHQITFFEFEDIFETLAKKSIDTNDYMKFGLFKDDELDTFTGNKLKLRLEANRELYEYVQKVHDFGLDEDELEKRFSPTGLGRMKREDWYETSFSEVNRFHQELLDLKKKTSVELTETSVKGLKFWDRPQKETAAGLRKRHIIIFNPYFKNEVLLNASFSFQGGNVKSLSDKFLTNSNNKDCEVTVGRTNLSAVIRSYKNQPTFVKLSYKHDNRSTLGADLFIVVLPVEPNLLEHYKTCYLIEPKNNIIALQFEGKELSFGYGFSKKTIEIYEDNCVIDFDDQGEQLNLVPQPESFNDEEELKIRIRLTETGVEIPILLKNELPESIPITSLRIWKLKRETQQDFEWINNRLLLGNREFYLNAEYKHYFEWELDWVEKGIKCAELESDTLVPKDLSLSDELRESYSRFLTYFKIRRSIPSLCHYNHELSERATEFLVTYISEIKSFQEGYEAGKKGRDLFKLGTVYAHNTIYFTPFHPVMIAFQLELNKLLSNEELDNSILNRLKPEGLVPYIYDKDDHLYKPNNQNTVMDWMVFKPVNQVTVSDANKYLARVIEDKIEQFEGHFTYLFSESSKAPLRINLINIENDYEVLRGIIHWILKKLEVNGFDHLKKVEISLYRESNLESSFDIFSRINTIEEFESRFNIKLVSKQYEKSDLIRIIREKLSYFKKQLKSTFNYAHISFYKMHEQEHYALQPMSDMVSGITLDGLYTSVPSMKSNENYRSGFGIRAYSLDENELLVQTAYYINELSANLRNGGNDTYRKGEAIFARTTTADEKTLDEIFKSSFWVTFVDSNVDLEFFNDNFENLVVIHYSDQYSSSSRFDAITVTDKSQQYYSVIKEFLYSKEVESNEDNVKNTIRAFNTFNGEWLLRIIGSKGHYSREKLSIISAIKFALSYFDHPNILWVPISLEEILRVAGAVSLSRTEGIFTAKNLGVKGSHSDDLLLIGLENSNDQLKMYFYPIEVKIGANKNDVLEKAKIQVKQTKKLITEALSNEEQKRFTSRFYRNFFAQLFISNAKKLHQGQIWAGKTYQLSEQIIERLIKDDFVLANDLESIIGDGAILSFQRDAYHRSSNLDEGITFLNLTEFDGYSGLVKSMEEMSHWIQDKKGDFIKEKMLSYLYNRLKPSTDEEEAYDEGLTELPEQYSLAKKDQHVEEIPLGIETMEEDISKMAEEHEPVQYIEENDLEKVRILLGRAENSNREIYWEYGNTGLANRHLLISGKSGQGKTYFMQCILLEKSKYGISSIVIDYTEGFLPNQLEPEFVDYLGPKLKQKVVYSEKLPINPFKKNIRDIGGITLPESNTDVAERIKSVFAAVYKSLGIQQLNAIYEAVLNGMERFEDELSLPKLRDILEEDNSNYAKTALSQIRPLIDRDPFSHQNTINWKDIVESNGEVFIIQLTGYPRDVQLTITEFILWDLWNYTVRFGNKSKPLPVIMDEAQNLDHTEKSPSARILTEGRKFGWSAWYATQFLKSQLDADELARLQNASQKVYFAQPEQEISYISSNLSTDASERKRWEQKISSLKKGQCIIHAPILHENEELSKPTITVVDILPLSERILK